jgi:spore maturation protein CgeB
VSRPRDIVMLGLSLTSAWGNGHATTFRALLRGLAREGHRLFFLERDTPWYAAARDLPAPDFCELALYDSLAALETLRARIRDADTVILGSYVPDGIEVLDRVRAWRSAPLAFYDIDTPVTLAALETGDAEYLARRQLPLLDLYLSFAGGAALDRLRDLGARNPATLYCSVDPERYRPLDVPLRWDLGYLGTYSPDRQPALEALLIEPARRRPDLRFVVAGAQFPEGINWPANVERIDHVAPADHAAFYCAQRFTLNVTRADMRRIGHSPSVRLFEAAACGTAILSDRWPGLGEVLPEGEALLTAATPEDVLAALALPEAARRALAEAARARVLVRHTGRARARELLAHLQAMPATTEFAI